MKKSIITILMALPFAAFALTVPKTTAKTLKAHPLSQSECGYECRDDGTVAIAIGTGGGTVEYVADPHAIHGYKIEEIARAEMAIAKTGDVIYNPTNDSWDVTTYPATNRIIVTCAPDVEISKVTFNYRIGYASEMSPDGAGNVHYSFTNNVCVIELINLRAGGYVYPGVGISNLRVWRVGFGSKKFVNDLRVDQYDFIDSLGSWTLGGLRSWVKHLYDGDRGHDWYKYEASNRVHLCGHSLTFDRNKRFRFEFDNAAGTNLYFRAADHEVLSVYASGTGHGYEDAFRVTSFERGSNFVEFAYVEDIDGFALSHAQVIQAAELSGPWTTNTTTAAMWDTVDVAEISDEFGTHKIYTTNHFVRVTGQTAARQFYRVTYVPEYVTDIFRSEIHLTDLYLKGEDSKIYKITVNGGTISATEVTE